MKGSIFRIVIAYPSDMSLEADIVCKVIEEINGWVTDTRAITLQPIRWTENAWPGVGEDAQDVINQQFPKDFELLVMLMGTRLGTPTSRAPSGTAEEFERAFKRVKAGENIKIFAYFSDKAITPSLLDLTQFELVRKFQSDIQARGVLTFSIKDDASFEKEFRRHIMRELEAWGSSAVKSTVKPQHILSARDIQGGTSPSFGAGKTQERSRVISFRFREGKFQDTRKASLEDIIRDVISIESENLNLQVFLDKKFTEVLEMRLITEEGINPEWKVKSEQILKEVARYKKTVGSYTRQLQKSSNILWDKAEIKDLDMKRIRNVTYRLEDIIRTNEDIVSSISRFPEFNQDDKRYRATYDESRRLSNTRVSQALINLRSFTE